MSQNNIVNFFKHNIYQLNIIILINHAAWEPRKLKPLACRSAHDLSLVSPPEVLV